MTKDKETYPIERDLVLKILAYIMNTEEEIDAEWGAGSLFEELPKYDDHENIFKGGYKPEVYYELLEDILGKKEDGEGNLDHDLYYELSHMLNRVDF